MCRSGLAVKLLTADAPKEVAQSMVMVAQGLVEQKVPVHPSDMPPVKTREDIIRELIGKQAAGDVGADKACPRIPVLENNAL